MKEIKEILKKVGLKSLIEVEILTGVEVAELINYHSKNDQRFNASLVAAQTLRLTVTKKDIDRAFIQKRTEAFLANGGQIQKARIGFCREFENV